MISASSRAASVAAASFLPSASALPVPPLAPPPVPPLMPVEREISVRWKNSKPLRRLVRGVRQTNLEAAASLLPAADASGASGKLAGLTRPFAPARTHRATTRSATRGRGRMGTHGRRRKVQCAGAEECGHGKGALACLLRRTMSHHGGQLGRHRHEGVGIDGQRGCSACSHLHKGREGGR